MKESLTSWTHKVRDTLWGPPLCPWAHRCSSRQEHYYFPAETEEKQYLLSDQEHERQLLTLQTHCLHVLSWIRQHNDLHSTNCQDRPGRWITLINLILKWSIRAEAKQEVMDGLELLLSDVVNYSTVFAKWDCRSTPGFSSGDSFLISPLTTLHLYAEDIVIYFAAIVNNLHETKWFKSWRRTE